MATISHIFKSAAPLNRMLVIDQVRARKPAWNAPDIRRVAAGPASATGAGDTGLVLCVHFTSEWDSYSLWTAGAGADADNRPPITGLRITWLRRPSGVLWGEVSCHGSAACAAILLDRCPDGVCQCCDGAGGAYAGDRYRCDRDWLRSEGVPRRRAEILARLPERPLLATFARGPNMPPDMVRRIHRLLLAAAPSPEWATAAAPRRVASRQGLSDRQGWRRLVWSWRL